MYIYRYINMLLPVIVSLGTIGMFKLPCGGAWGGDKPCFRDPHSNIRTTCARRLTPSKNSLGALGNYHDPTAGVKCSQG